MVGMSRFGLRVVLLRGCRSSQPNTRRCFSSAKQRSASSASPSALSSPSSSSSSGLPPAPPARWVSDIRARLGRCMTFGCNAQQVNSAADILRTVVAEWLPLTAGADGFLSGPGRVGLQGQQVVWGEMDTFGHVNNVNYVRYAESSRVIWMHSMANKVDPAYRKQWEALMTPNSIGLILKSIRVDYKFPMVHPDSFSAFHKLRHQPSSDPAPKSLILDCIILSHNHRRAAAKTEEDVAIYDYQAGRATSMPSYAHSVLEGVWQRQQAETQRARTRIWELLGSVERLEKETWDRIDAVEDTGGAR